MACGDNTQTGDFILLSIDGNIIATQINSSLSSSFDLIDAGTKCDPVNSYFKPGLRSSSFSVDGNVPTGDAGYEAMHAKHFVPTIADVIWGDAGGYRYSAQAWINDFNPDAPKNGMCTFSATVTVNGPITPIAI